MAYLQEITATQQEQLRISAINNAQMIGLRPGEAYASYFPTWEVTAPQYPQPSPYSLQDVYRTNEVAYACIELLMDSISEPPIMVIDKNTREELKGHELTEFMKEPCPQVDEVDFWKATMMFLSIAGFMGWEQDTSNDGSLKSVYPVMPQYSSFMRGQGRLLDRIRYQPYTGMPYMDINIDRILYWMYPDPRYYGLKPLGPTARLVDIIPVDTDMTKIVGQFLRNGAFISGQLVTDQIIDAEDARFAKQLFRDTQGGPAHAGEILVTGKGMKFERMNNTFREMVFPEVDARNEVRICMAYGIKPILISAKVGMDRSTMNNYEEARRAQYHEKFTSVWRFLEKGLTRQLLPLFDKNPDHVCKFDLRNVEALQENRTEVWKRATETYKARIITRNDTLREMGLDPLDDQTLGNEYYTTAMSQTSNSLDVQDNSIVGTEKAPMPATEDAPDVPGIEKEKEEEKAFRVFAKKRLDEGKPHKVGAFEFKYVSPMRQRQLLTEFGVPDADAELVLKALLSVVGGSRKDADEMIININNPQGVDISSRETVEAVKELSKHLSNLRAEVKSSPLQPAPVVNVNVEPTPINNVIPEMKFVPPVVNVSVDVPKIKSTITRVKRDGANNLDGTITAYDYEEKE